MNISPKQGSLLDMPALERKADVLAGVQEGKTMSRLKQLIAELCPDGVEYKEIGKITNILRGKRLTKNQLSKDGKFPVFHGGLEPLGYYTESNRRANTVMIINVGASAGTVGFCSKEFWSSDGCFCVEHNDILLPKFIYYFLSSNELLLTSKVRHAGIPTLDANIIENIKIPIPHHQVQEEIVRILDTFTELTAELTAELTKRKQQYQYYSSRLLDLKNINYVKLNNVCKNISSGKNKKRHDDGIYPIYGSTGVIAKSDTFFFDKTQILVARVGVNAGYTYIADNKYDVSDNTLVLDIKDNFLLKYIYYQLVNFNINKLAKGGGQPLVTASQLKNIEIPVPSFDEQARIVAILDRFDALCNDLTSGLPAEIEARKKQYEYYRDKLLTFKEAV